MTVSKCNQLFGDEALCEEEAETGNYLCIFHDRSPDKELARISKRLKERVAATPRNGIIRLDNAFFPQGISFRDVVFDCSVRFVFAEFHGEKTDFSFAEFNGETTDFSFARFESEMVSFSRTRFLSRMTSFDNAQFLGGTTDFSDAQFTGEIVNFNEVQFCSGLTNFDSAEFQGQSINFDSTRFRGKTIEFTDAKFSGETTSFRSAEFHGDSISFRGTQFLNSITVFDFVQFGGMVLFSSSFLGPVFDKGTVSFQSIKVDQSAVLTFDSVNLSKAEFLWGDLARVNFLDVKWNHTVRRWRGQWRSRLYDEECWREKRREAAKVDSTKPRTPYRDELDDLTQLARLYRALKSYYRQTGEYQLLGHFHYGLMEVQWHQRELQPTTASRRNRRWLALKRWRKKVLSWEFLYRYSSGYGEDYAWSFWGIVVLILFFAGIYWLAGVPTPPEPEWVVYALLGTPTALNIEGLQYVSIGNPTAPELTSWWVSGVAALTYSLQTASIGRLQYFKDFIPKSIGVEIAYTLESILGPIQIAFFAVALRNRFRR